MKISNYYGCGHTLSNDKLDTKEHIKIQGHTGTWHVIDQKHYPTKGWFFLLEHERYGDEVACIIVSADYSLVLEDVWNGFGDLEEAWAYEEYEKSLQKDLKVMDRTDLGDKVIKLNVQWNGVYYSIMVYTETKVPIYFYNHKQPDDYIKLEQAIEKYLGIEVALPF